MRDPNRIDPMLALLGKTWKKNPDLRLGQLLVNAARPSEPVPQIFYLEDDAMEDGLRALAELTGVDLPEA